MEQKNLGKFRKRYYFRNKRFYNTATIDIGRQSSRDQKYNMSRDARKPDFCLCENKGADQLRGNREADQRLCFRYTDSTIPLLLKSEISSF